MGTVRRGILALTIGVGVAGGGWAAGGSSMALAYTAPHDYWVAVNGTNTSCATNNQAHPAGSIQWVLTNCVATDTTTPTRRDTIHVGAGDYYENLTITGNVNLYGAGPTHTRIIGVAYDTPDITNNGFTVAISGLTLTHLEEEKGVGAAFCGGGLYNHGGGVLTMTNSAVTKNSSNSDGGGICNVQATMTVINTSVTYNYADDNGGGIENNGGTMSVTNSPLRNNDAEGTGGGINNTNGGTFTLGNSPVSHNQSGSSGGGIENEYNSTMKVSGSPITFNFSYGPSGGVDNYSGSAIWITNSAVTNNQSPSIGGGLSNYNQSTMTLTNSPVTFNTAGFDGGGIWWDNGYGGFLTLVNETISHNKAGGDGGGVFDSGDDTCSTAISMTNTSITADNPDNCS